MYFTVTRLPAQKTNTLTFEKRSQFRETRKPEGQPTTSPNTKRGVIIQKIQITTSNFNSLLLDKGNVITVNLHNKKLSLLKDLKHKKPVIYCLLNLYMCTDYIHFKVHKYLRIHFRCKKSGKVQSNLF